MIIWCHRFPLLLCVCNNTTINSWEIFSGMIYHRQFAHYMRVNITEKSAMIMTFSFRVKLTNKSCLRTWPVDLLYLDFGDKPFVYITYQKYLYWNCKVFSAYNFTTIKELRINYNQMSAFLYNRNTFTEITRYFQYRVLLQHKN